MELVGIKKERSWHCFDVFDAVSEEAAPRWNMAMNASMGPLSVLYAQNYHRDAGPAFCVTVQCVNADAQSAFKNGKSGMPYIGFRMGRVFSAKREIKVLLIFEDGI